MKIVHICQYYDGSMGYQENILPYYHSKLGHETLVITSTLAPNFGYNKNSRDFPEGETIQNGVKIRRIKIRKDFTNRFVVFNDLYKELKIEKPDLIFHHGLCATSLLTARKYKKNHDNCRLVADTHVSYDNSAQNIISKRFLHGFLWKKITQYTLPFIEKVYAIAPGCKVFAHEIYSVPEEKMEYLFLGADTEKINFIKKQEIKNSVRKKLNIKDSDFVLITGGKLTKEKNTKLLLDALKRVNSNNIRLIIFGVFSDDIKNEILEMIKDDPRVNFIGWINGDEVYDYYLSSDAAIFPGTKSALWEQAICSGLPIICKRWKGMEYVDVGGNCIFIDVDDEGIIVQAIQKLMGDKEKYLKMKLIAESQGYETFSYERIAKQSITF